MSVVAVSVLYGVAAAIGWGVADFLAAIAAKRLGVLRTATGVHLASCVAAAGYLFVVYEPGALAWTHWAALAAVSVLGLLAYIAFYRALSAGPVAVVSPITSAYAIVVIALAMMLAGERLGGWQALGAACSISGVALASFDPRGFSSGGRVIGLGVLLAIAAALGIGLMQYALGILSRDIGWFLPVYINRALVLGLFLPLTIAMRQWTLGGVTLPLAAGVAVAGVAEIGGMFAYARGAEIGVISIVAAASIGYPLIPMVGGIVMFGERLAVSQWVGLGVALAGLFVLALAS